LRLSFEPGDLVNEVTSFGSPTAIDVHVSGNKLDLTLPHARKVLDALKGVPELVDLQMAEAQDYPTVDVTIDREKAGMMNLTARDVAAALVPATASSRYVMPIYWRDPGSGQAYIVQIQIPPPSLSGVSDLAGVTVRGGASGDDVLLRDVIKSIRETQSAGQIDRYNMRRSFSLIANVATADLGAVKAKIDAAIKSVGPPPTGVEVAVRGQIELLSAVQQNLLTGLAVAVAAIGFMLTAYYQSIRLALATLAALPAALVGVAVVLAATKTTVNLQSFMGAIMALGVAVANAILLVTFAERSRGEGLSGRDAAFRGGASRLRPILMTSFAMIAGMVPMALGLGEGGDQTAPLGRAVVGGLAFATLASLFVVPCAFAVLMGRSGTASASLDPEDPASRYFDGTREAGAQAARLSECGACAPA
jgi:multidrug efflux pump subunit AcrB